MSWRVWIWLLSLSVLWGGSFFFAKVGARRARRRSPSCSAAWRWRRSRSISCRPLRRDAPWRTYFAMGAAEQRRALRADLLGPDAHRLGPGLDPQRHDAAVHGRGRALLTNDEKMTGAQGRGAAGRLRRRRRADRPAALARPTASLWGATGLPGRRAVLCLRRHLRPALPRHGHRAPRRRGRPGTASSVLILPIMLIVEQPWTLRAAAAPIWAALAGLALLSTALAYVLYFRILAAAGATNLLLVTFLIPVDVDPAGRAVPARAAGAAPLRRHGADRPRAGRDRRPDRASRAPREIAVRLHNCASRGRLVRVQSNPSNRAERVLQWPSRPPR